MKPIVHLRALLAKLATRNPEVYQQLTMPGAGFGAIPDHVLEDEHNEWWDSGAADELIAECYVAIDERHPPEIDDAPESRVVVKR